MLEARGSVTRKYDAGNDDIQTLVRLMGLFISETYGSSLSIDPDSIETIGKLHSYVDVYYSELLDGYMLIRKYSHIFFISAEQVDGKASFTGPDRNTALKMLEEVKYNTIRTGEMAIMEAIAEELSGIHEIMLSMTPVMEILRELLDKGKIILVSTGSDDKKRLKYFNEISDLSIFKYEYKYNACIIERGPEFNSIADGNIENLFAYIIKSKTGYVSDISSVKPYLRTAYSYYSLCMVSKSLIEIKMETLRNEYGRLYGKTPDTLKFKNYVESLCNVNIFQYKNDKIIGIEKIFKKLL
ncbi:MAG: hypothetical protein RE471_00995 [Ferroplasma sp.]|uniref:hypothetical protein n=1 Tax=Ferroplasma sp. TaxID=2591003 RepID=UPI002815E052|nr:hypothetical protein [Ferroplasma sp.]WMT51472.1 MAG: hypothetical protein RE471_00995 [Ferroplasma sp.]